ncbi:PP2C family protein-serine/threonine phosphatase [Jatrophihabitans fulvus]
MIDDEPLPSALRDGIAVAGSAALSRVVADAPSAVLLVDLDDGRVIYANELARQFAPGLDLPVDVAAWSERAGLRDGDGEELELTSTPLSRVAAGNPVNGETVTALRSSDVSEAREQLWVIGTPLVDAPEPLGRQALVLLLPLRDVDAVAQAQAGAADLRHRAVLASQLAFSISDPTSEDNPLIWVNPAFELTTGYKGADVLGRNCRFLQGQLTDPATVTRIREKLANDDVVNETLLNYRADGTAFWNHLVISPVFDADGRLTHHVGVQTDVTERVDTERALQVAVQRAQASSTRQRAVAAAGAALSTYLSSAERLLGDLPSLVVSHFPGWCAALTLDEGGSVSTAGVAASTTNDGATAFWRTEDELRGFLATQYERITAAVRSPSTEWPVVLNFDAAGAAGGPSTEKFQAVFARIATRGAVTGLLVLIRPDGGLDDPDEVEAIADLALRAGAALDNTRLYSLERDAALTLQQSMLPALPTLDRFDLAASYIPASEAAVGGDWFDIVELPGPWIGAAVGDVIGHDMKAAAAMGQLRSMVRTLAWEGHEPAQLITKLDALVRDLGIATFATLLYLLIDEPTEVPHADGGLGLTYTSAGHLPAMLRRPDGSVERLDTARTSPIGVADPRLVEQARVRLEPGSTLVLYTDGLLERRGIDLEHGFVELERILAAMPAEADATSVRDAITSQLIAADLSDDACVLVIRVRDDSTR